MCNRSMRPRPRVGALVVIIIDQRRCAQPSFGALRDVVLNRVLRHIFRYEVAKIEFFLEDSPMLYRLSIGGRPQNELSRHGSVPHEPTGDGFPERKPFGERDQSGP